MKAIALFLFVIFGGFCASSSTISDFFIADVADIDFVFSTIDKSSRMDMVDYYNSGMKIEIDNSLGGKSKIEEMTPTYMKVKLSESATVEMQMEVAGKTDTLLFVIKTLKTPALDSSIKVFDRYWNEVDCFKMPQVEDFIVGASSKKKKELLSMVEFPLIYLKFNNGAIEAIPSLKDYMIKENYELLKPFLKDKLVYEWDGKQFKMSK